MNYMGDYTHGQIVYIWFNTFDSNDPSASVTITNFVDTDVHIHRDDNLTQRNDTAGVAIDIDVDAITGTHFISIDTADDTVANFWQIGHDYFVRIEGITVDAATVNAAVGCFSLENRRVAGEMAKSQIATLASQTSFTLTAGEASGDDDAYNGCTAIITDEVTMIQKCAALISDYTGSSRTVTLAVDPAIFTMAVQDKVTILAGSKHALRATTPVADGQTLDVTTGGNAGIDWGNVANPTTALDLSGTDTQLVDTTTTVTNQVTADVTAISGDSTAADNLEALMDGVLVISVNDASATTTAFATDGFTEATDDHFNGRLATFITGALLYQQTDVTDYDAAGGAQGSQEFTVTALTSAPADDDQAIIH